LGHDSDKKAMGILFKPASAHGVEHLNTDERIIKIIDCWGRYDRWRKP
jgi:hypothetical protein